PIDEAHLLELDPADGQVLPTTDHQTVAGSVDLRDVPGPRLPELSQARPLADGVDRAAAVLTQRAAALVHHLPGPQRQPPGEVGGGLATWDEADLHALPLVRDVEPEITRDRPHLGLGETAQREANPSEALTVEVVEHVGLVLGRIEGGV